MDTSRSERVVQNFLQHEPRYKRKIQEFSENFETTPETIFPLLCPAREADWIPGWKTELIFTKSGYAEDKCVFRTDKSNSAGEGLWTFTGFKLNEFIEFVRFQRDVLRHCKIHLTQNEDGTTTASWKTISTALSEKGNKLLDNISTKERKRQPIFELIDYYLRNGEMISKLSLIKNKIHGRH